MDRREARRFSLNLPVHFFWKSYEGSEEVGTGVTRDISYRGLFVRCDACPPTGNTLQAKVMLPSPEGSDLVIHIGATVVRVESTDSGNHSGGFAALTKKYALERQREEQGTEQEILDESQDEGR
jgi:hypothetical protein